MATLLRMPEVAANATHATLAAWSKKEGEPIAVGDCLAEVETDKAIMDVEVFQEGFLSGPIAAGIFASACNLLPLTHGRASSQNILQ